MFVRFQSAVPNARGTDPGIFALTNGLRDTVVLTDEDEAWVREHNARADRAYPDPRIVSPDCYDLELHPGARAWFRAGARPLLELARAYTALLDRYEVPWVELRTERPGLIVHEDAVQVVAVPFTFPEDWALGAGRHRHRGL